MVRMDFFVITPYRLDPLFGEKKKIIQNVSKLYSMTAYFASEQLSTDDLYIENTLNLFKKIKFFIADLSYERPSCYFEVGFAQALNKPVYLLAQQATIIHQLLNSEKIRFYKDLKEYETLIHIILRSKSV